MSLLGMANSPHAAIGATFVGVLTLRFAPSALHPAALSQNSFASFADTNAR
jgi:hypothetical protein